jgi:hypothetical protein
VQDILDFREKLLKAGVDPNQASKIIGTWVNPETGNSEIDFSANLPDLRAALETAQRYGQIAIYDHSTGGVIYTNGAMGGQMPGIGERAGWVAAKAAPVKVQLLPDEVIEERGRAGEEWKNWYNNLVDFMYNDFLPDARDYVPLISDLFGATSARNKVSANVTVGTRLFRQFVKTGEVTKVHEGKEWMEGHYTNIQRIVRGEPISGGKVDEFSPATMGDPYGIAIDIHVGRNMYGIPLKNTPAFPKAETWSPNPNQRIDAQKVVIRIADRMGWDWAQLQAALFSDHIKQTGKPIETFEQFLTKYKDEYRKLIDEDLKKGGKGASLGRGILERTSTRVGPEKLLGLKVEDEAAIRRRRAEAILGPYHGTTARATIAGRTEAGIIVDPKLAAGISLTGPKGKIAAGKMAPAPIPSNVPSGTGTTPQGAATTAFDRRIKSAWHLGTVYEGAKQVFWNSVGLQGLGDRIHIHTDTRAKMRGEYTYPLHQWEKTVSRSEKKAAINENYDYWDKKAKGLPLLHCLLPGRDCSMQCRDHS